jgi:hypothetical protein
MAQFLLGLNMGRADAYTSIIDRYLSATITLQNTGTDPRQDYDLRVYCDDCHPEPDGVSNYIGDDQITVRWDEETILGVPSGSDSGRFIFIEVIRSSGTLCDPWTLRVIGDTAASINTCDPK